jgi:CheY-like chemotaxis protein
MPRRAAVSRRANTHVADHAAPGYFQRVEAAPSIERPHVGVELPHVGVMIVDDDWDAREVLADLLRRVGYTCVTARDGAEALALLDEVSPELIVLDVVMPGMDGAQFRERQRRNPTWIRIPTVVMTGAAEEPVLDVAVEETLRKPVRARDVLPFVIRHCAKQ